MQRPQKQHSGLQYKHQNVPLKPIEDNILQLVCHRAMWKRMLHRNNARWNIEWYYSAIHLYVCCFPGSFREAEAETGQYVRWLRDYCQAFYYRMVVKLLPPVTVAATGCAFRVSSSSHNLRSTQVREISSRHRVMGQGSALWGVSQVLWGPQMADVGIKIINKWKVVVIVSFRGFAVVSSEEETVRCLRHHGHHHDRTLPRRFLELCVWTGLPHWR